MPFQLIFYTGSKTKLVFITYLQKVYFFRIYFYPPFELAFFNRGLRSGGPREVAYSSRTVIVPRNIVGEILSSFLIPFQTCTFYIMIVLILASVIFDQLVIDIIYVIYNKMSIFNHLECKLCQNLLKIIQIFMIRNGGYHF